MSIHTVSPQAKALIRKIHRFNFVWCVLSVGLFLFIYLAGIHHPGIIAGMMLSFIFGGEAVFHYRLLNKVTEVCQERHPHEPWRARQEYKSHLIVLVIMAIIGAIGILQLIISLLLP